MYDTKINEMKNAHRREMNRQILISWTVITLVLFVSYLMEVVKGERTLLYFCTFMLATALPLTLCYLRYKFVEVDPHFSAYVIMGYMVMYAFVLLTGSTTMVFSYILPMLSFMVLFHEPRLIMWTAAVSIALNIASIVMRYNEGKINISNSKDAEIQIALICLCFAGAWLSSRMYNRIICDHEEALQQVLSQQSTIKKLEQDMQEDRITGLCSRAAYETALDEMDGAEKVGVIFCDINALKYTNDHLGHKAGDELLKKLADLMTIHFRKSDCYRVSGDEFVVILHGLRQEVFEIRAKRFYDAAWCMTPPLASIGWDYNTGVKEAVKNAEIQMYVDKNDFYQKYPKYKRI